jgi:hypothetical protein
LISTNNIPIRSEYLNSHLINTTILEFDITHLPRNIKKLINNIVHTGLSAVSKIPPLTVFVILVIAKLKRTICGAFH